MLQISTIKPPHYCHIVQKFLWHYHYCQIDGVNNQFNYSILYLGLTIKLVITYKPGDSGMKGKVKECVQIKNFMQIPMPLPIVVVNDNHKWKNVERRWEEK